MLDLVDTHAHIHSDDYGLDADRVLAGAKNAGVSRIICVGTTLSDSQNAIKFADKHNAVWASAGIHPHEAEEFLADPHNRTSLEAIIAQKSSEVVAIGEIGLDYYYEHSVKSAQKEVLIFQLELAQQYRLPVIFHIRGAAGPENIQNQVFSDFFEIVDRYPDLIGVVHSFSATEKQLELVLSRKFYIGLNGIMTFTKDRRQLEAAKAVSLDRLLLETDAPYLTPAPYRGTVCKSEHVRVTAEFLAELRGETLEVLARATTQNARSLFNI